MNEASEQPTSFVLRTMPSNEISSNNMTNIVIGKCLGVGNYGKLFFRIFFSCIIMKIAILF